MTEKNVQTEVFYPLLKSIISGVLVGLAAVSLYGLYLQVTPWRLFFAIVAIVALLSWLAVIRAMSPSPKLETVQPAKVYPDESTRLNVNVNDFDKPYPRARRGKIRCKKKLPELARLILVMGKSYSYADLEGKGKLFNRTEFEHVRSDMMDLGLLYWKNPDNHRDGVGFTVGGIAFLERIKREYDTSPPLRTKFSPGLANAE